jgi:AcrR family transcriptional regulator
VATTSTRDRLLDGGLRLFADQGYRATTIRQIEATAGLQPGRGGFYRHFPSKEALLSACLLRWREEIEAFGAGLIEPPDGGLRSELEHLVRGSLALLDRQRPLLALMQREGAELPAVAEVHELLVRRGYRNAVAVFGRLLERHGRTVAPADLRAVAAIALGSIVHFREDQAVYGRAPADASEAAFVRTWVEVWATYLGSHPPGP